MKGGSTCLASALPAAWLRARERLLRAPPPCEDEAGWAGLVSTCYGIGFLRRLGHSPFLEHRPRRHIPQQEKRGRAVRQQGGRKRHIEQDLGKHRSRRQ